MTKIKLKDNTNTILVYSWMKAMFGDDRFGNNWQIVTYFTPSDDTTFLEIYIGEPEKITFAIIRWS